MVLGPGAFGSAAGMRPYVGGLRRRGIEARAIDLPRGRAELAVPRFAELAAPGVVAGGHSFGGRVASLAAVEGDFAGLLLLSFPLAGRAAVRTAHFDRIGCPVLMLSGDSDPLAPAEELEAAARRLPAGRLVLFAGAGHDLGEALEPALDEAAGFVSTLAAGTATDRRPDTHGAHPA